MSEPTGIDEEPVIPLAYLGDFDAMVVMRSKDKEMAFVMRRDMPEEAFAQVCARLRELVLP